MFEIEMKFSVKEFDRIEAQFEEWKVSGSEICRESDRYFNAPDRDFGVTDEALRIRSIGEENCITYKGPKEKSTAKIRKEIEVGIARGEQSAHAFTEILKSLGFRPVAVVRKNRRKFPLQRDGFAMEITLDNVEKLGRFVEVEIVTSEEDKDRAEKLVEQLARELGLQNHESRSYLEMILEKNPRAG